jgi:hypothetical protein
VVADMALSELVYRDDLIELWQGDSAPMVAGHA